MSRSETKKNFLMKMAYFLNANSLTTQRLLSISQTMSCSSCGESNTPRKEEKSWRFIKVRELFLTIEKKKELDYNRRNLVLQREHNVLTWNILICTYGS